MAVRLQYAPTCALNSVKLPTHFDLLCPLQFVRLLADGSLLVRKKTCLVVMFC